MFKKQYRITKDKEYDNIFKNGRSSYSDLLGIKFISNSFQYNRVGIIVSNKVSKSAVRRVLIKRRLREIFKNQFHQIKPGVDIVIIALPEISGKNYQEIEKAADLVLKKAGLLA